MPLKGKIDPNIRFENPLGDERLPCTRNRRGGGDVRILELFAGVGMFSYGLHKLGWETAAFVEIDPWCQRVLQKNFPGVPIYSDVCEVGYERLEADGVGRVDVITGGFPCQDLSVAGKQKGIDGERSGLWSEFARIIGELRPRYAIIETVPALLTGDGGRWFDRVLIDLAEIGFDAEWHVVPAGNPDGRLSAGAPHRRERAWIVAYPCREGLQGRHGDGCSGKARQARREPNGHPATTSASKGQTRQNGTTQSGLGLLAHGIAAGLSGSRWLEEPGIGRVATGVPDRVNKLKALGNGLVWQIPYAIGKAIMERENAKRQS